MSVIDSLLEAVQANAEAARDAAASTAGVTRPDSAATYAMAAKTLADAACALDMSNLRRHPGTTP